MKRIVLSTALAMAIAMPAAAKDKPPVFVETASIPDKPVFAFNPAKAYVLLRTEVATPLLLMKVPTAEDQSVYDKLRAGALDEARRKYAKKLASYNQSVALATKASGTRVPEKPVEPTEANFEFTPFGMMASVSVGPMYRFAKSKTSSTYLQELTPGTYRVYGTLSAVPGAAAAGSCYCMGSVAFEVKAGEITDLGVIMAGEPFVRVSGDSSAPVDLSGQKLFQAAPAGMVIDPRIAGQTITAARYKPVGKLPNYFGVTITRMPEMPGIFRYDRDKIVDLTGQ
jgi:predicted membrane protein